MNILEKHFFDNGLVRVCLVVVDDGHAIKAYLGPLARWADMNDDDAAAYVANVGAACPLQMALTLAGPRTWAAAAKYEPALAAIFARSLAEQPASLPDDMAAIFHQGRRSGPTWPGAPAGRPTPAPAGPPGPAPLAPLAPADGLAHPE